MTTTRLYYLGLSAICVGLAISLVDHYPLFSWRWWLLEFLAFYAAQPILNACTELLAMLRPERSTPDPYQLIDNKPVLK